MRDANSNARSQMIEVVSLMRNTEANAAPAVETSICQGILTLTISSGFFCVRAGCVPLQVLPS
ncbi:MAG: hypothetical protein ABIS29_04580, partial [Vicinamibacterales bacterium]